jgi:hypothetical protein
VALPSLGAALLAAAAALAQGGFEVYVWRSTPEPEGARAVWERLGGVIAQRGEPLAAWLEAGLAVGLFNAAGRDALHLERESPAEAERWQRWYDTRDPAHAVRAPCLSEPGTQAELARTLARSLAAAEVQRLAWVALGDEVALTAHAAPGELCLCAHCGAAWTRYLAERSDLAETERAAWADPTSGDTDRARLALADGDLARLGPWLVRRQFQAALIEGALRALERQARAERPDAALALLGLGAQSAFGTPRLERGFGELEVLEAYRESDARELLLSLRGARTRVLLTVFPDLHEADRVRADVWEHALAGGDGVVLWSDATLGSDPALVEGLAAALAGVRSLRGALGGARLGPRGVALVHDFESLCLAWLRDALLDGATWPRRFHSHQVEHGTWEGNAAGWLQLARDVGLQPGAVPLERVDGATAARFPVLVASELGVVEESEARGLEAFLDAGGTLLVSGEFARCDSRGRIPATALLERLRERASERVLAVDGRAADYRAERRLHTPRARLWREQAAAWFAPAGAGAQPFELAPRASDLPWIVSWTRTPAGDVVGAALPGWRDVEGNAPLTELALEVRPRGALALEWLHPAGPPDADGAMPLAPGEAGVFRLRARASDAGR